MDHSTEVEVFFFLAIYDTDTHLIVNTLLNYIKNFMINLKETTSEL